LFEQHLERTRTHPSATGRSNITLETRDIGSSDIEASSTRTANGAAVGFFGARFSSGSVIEHVFDLTGGV
jgi:hypothetical protein